MTIAKANLTHTPSSLPLIGYSRKRDLLPFLPFGSTTLDKWVKEGRFPQPVKFSPSMTAWSNESVIEWLKEYANKTVEA